MTRRFSLANKETTTASVAEQLCFFIDERGITGDAIVLRTPRALLEELVLAWQSTSESCLLSTNLDTEMTRTPQRILPFR